MATTGAPSPTEFHFQPLFELAPDTTDYRRLGGDHVSRDRFAGQDVLRVAPEGLALLAREAMRDVSFLLRTSHLEKVAAILDDPAASDNDKGVALAMLKNAEIAAAFALPLCQDTGTATVFAKKGQRVWTGADDEEWLSRGIYDTYREENLRYSQTAALTLYEEVNTRTNLPAQIDIHATPGDDYRFLFVAKGGGSANKTMLFQETRAILNPAALEKFLGEKMVALGTAGCPPYHLGFVIGGTSAEACLKTVKLATSGYLDRLPESGNAGGRAFRDPALEARLLDAAWRCGIGAQFGGKYFALDVRVVRLPRHGASCPIGIGVSCSADRNIKARIDRDGIWLEELERDPGRFVPERLRHAADDGAVRIDLTRPMPEILAELHRHPVTTRLRLSGPIVVARDMAHARLKERLDRGEGLPRWFSDHPVYYAGPAKTPAGMPSGSFGPTTAGRMDSYVDLFQRHGASRVMIAKGNRSHAVTASCREHGGFYLGSIGGPGALLARENIRKVEVLEYPDLGMEAVYRIEVEDFPAFILIDDKGNDFFAQVACHLH
jgi:fumarate hydratase class I